MSREVDWTFLAWSDVTALHWRTAGKVCRALYDFAEDGTGSLKRLRAADRIGATHALLVPPFMAYVSFDKVDGILRVWRVRRYVG
jgi:hypothetical protein